VAELKRLGKTFESKSYPNEGHGFRNPDNQIDMYRRLEAFFLKHLGSCGPSGA
jgi:dipeptidyl aminopeptidase/acylaminoacyl peptidase